MKAADFKREAGDELLRILRYWMENSPDWKQGGFLGRIDGFNRQHPDAPKGLQLNSGILWTFSAASWFARNDIYLAVARRAYEYIAAFFLDRNDGGAWWSLDAAGQPLDRRKRVEGQASLIYGLTEYFYASDDLVPLRHAISLFRLIEEHSLDQRHGGYFDAFAHDDDCGKSLDTHLRLLEAYTNLYRHWQDGDLRRQIIGLLTLFDRHLIDTVTGHLGISFSADWQPRSILISYGNDIEAAWLLRRAAEAIADMDWTVKAASMAVRLATAAAEGLDADGGLWHLHEVDHIIREKHGWAQAEAIVGFLDCWEISGAEIWWQRSTGCWNFLRYIIDSPGKEWHEGVLADHSPIPGQDKAGFEKSPVHNARACMEVVRRLTDRERARVPEI